MSNYAYFDHNATTPLADAVKAAMLPWLGANFGNSASRHRYGRNALAAVDRARQQLAAAINAAPNEIIFTSGGSEANNFALKSVLSRESWQCAGQLIIGAIEHPSVIEPARQVSKLLNWQYNSLGVDRDGYYRCEDLIEYFTKFKQQPGEQNARARVSLLALMSANNESGICQPIDTLAQTVLEQQSPYVFHCDAVQHLGKMSLDFRRYNQAGVTSMAISAHKINGPQGIGALVVDKRLLLQPLIAGGGHEQGLRAGTLNVAAIVGFGVAAELAATNVAAKTAVLTLLRLQLEKGLKNLGAVVFAATANRLQNTTFFAFPAIDGETLVGKLDALGFAVASGAACSNLYNQGAPISHVLQAMQVAPELAKGAVRISLSAGNTPQEIALFLQKLQGCVQELRKMKSLL